jgi:uncharacterized membrane protein
MKRLITVLLAAFLLTPLACNKSDRGGGADARSGFKISAPVLATSVKQGDRETVKLTLDRGKEFKSDVKLKVSAPKGLKVDLATTEIKASDAAEVSVTITADKDAPLGEHTVTVTGTPEKGASATVDFKVSVKENKA